MPRYRVSANLTISVSTVVDAASPEEAKNVALERGVQGLCYHCGSSPNDQDEEEWRTSGELDGLPQEDTIHVDEES